MLDIDHFKQVNDSYGHGIGDQVLEGLADLVKINLRQVDILARYGGEEFVVLLPETSLEDALVTSERLREETSKTPLLTKLGLMSITISLGVVILDETCRNLEELLDRSDQALYVSKRTGRNRVSSWKLDYAKRPPGTGPLPVIKQNEYLR
jgi:diguanylate cyclase (GGDEF)-like protein